jgi:hypothetical protein
VAEEVVTHPLIVIIVEDIDTVVIEKEIMHYLLGLAKWVQ